MEWRNEIKDIFKKRYGGFDKYFKPSECYDIWNDWNDDEDEINPFILFDRNESYLYEWLEDNDISQVNCVFIQNGKIRKYRKLTIKECEKIDATVKKPQLAKIDEILCFDDCRCVLLDKTNKKKPTFYICLDKSNKKVNKMLNLFRQYFKKQVSEYKSDNKDWEKQQKEQEKQEKIERANEKKYKQMLKNGIYHLLGKEDLVFFEMCTRSNGFLAGEFITLAYTTNVPIHQFALMLHHDLWEVLGSTKNDVLFLTANDKYFFTDIIKDLFIYDEDNKCLNNIGLNITTVKQIESILLSKRPKIIIVDNLQSLEGNSAENVRLLKKMCKRLRITCFCLFEMNNVNPKKVPDISRIGTRSGIVDQSDKVFIIWNVEQIQWTRTFHDHDRPNPELDYDDDDNLILEEDGSEADGHKEKLYIISIDCVKNRRYKLFRDFIWYCPYDNSIETIEKKNKKDIVISFIDEFGDGSYNGFDTRPIADAIAELSSTIDSKEIPTFDGFVWNMN